MARLTHLSYSLAAVASQCAGTDRLRWYIAMLACALVFCAPGCHLVLPDISHEPQIHNPFPQLSRVAIAPFFNLSDEPTLDARRFSLAYFSELQSVPGFEVVPLGVVEQAIVQHAVDLSDPGESQRLAKILGVDAVVVGSITDYSPFMPPRCGLRVEWYSANSGYHEIPPGYGLPWGTPEEEFIPQALVYEAEMALARAQMATQTPDCTTGCESLQSPPVIPVVGPSLSLPQVGGRPSSDANIPAKSIPAKSDSESLPALPPVDGETTGDTDDGNFTVGYDEPIAGTPTAGISETIVADGMPGAIGPSDMLPPDWPDERGFIPAPPSPVRPVCVVNYGPVLTHTQIYHGDASQFTEALAGYAHSRNDDRFSGWETYLQRSDAFIRFCCHLHIAEMLSARGGAGETRVVCEWPSDR